MKFSFYCFFFHHDFEFEVFSKDGVFKIRNCKCVSCGKKKACEEFKDIFK